MEALRSRDEPTEVISLSAGQVDSMLRALDLHRNMLQVGHEDARRLSLSQLRPAYLLDFELIHRYVFRADGRPDWVSELQYLLCREQTTLLIGPGTQFEIEKFIHSIGFVINDEGHLEDRMPDGGRNRRIRDLEPEVLGAGLNRLSRLLKLPNLKRYGELMGEPEVDEEAFETAKAALDSRRKERADANWSDALNWAAVVHLRYYGRDLNLGFHPYLLTATRPLLDETAWSNKISPPVSRRPSDAVYTEVLLDTFDDPAEAANHTVQMAFKASTLERELRMMPAYLIPDDFADDPEFERAVEQNRVGDDLRRQLGDLAAFVRDPVVTEAQRIYDNARLASANAVQQLGTVSRPSESPQRLFDLIVEVSAALNADRGKNGLGELWKLVLRLEVDEDADANQTSFKLLESGSHGRPRHYLAAEWYPSGAAADTRDQIVFRWPTSLDAEAALAAFSRAFARNGENMVDLMVGTDHGVDDFGAELPISLGDVIEAVHGAGEYDAEGRYPGQLRWVRMSGSAFDLYVDVAATDVAREPLVGVFAEHVDPSGLEELYLLTSARYLLPAWLKQALMAIGEMSK